MNKREQEQADFKWLLITENKYFKSRKEIKGYLSRNGNSGDNEFDYLFSKRLIVFLPPISNQQ